MEFLILVSTFSVLLPALIGVILSPNLERRLNYLVMFLFFTLFVEILATYCVLHKISNYTLYDWFTVIEYVFFALFYRSLIRNRIVSAIILLTIVTYVAGSMVYIFMYYSDTFSSLLNIVESILIVSLVLVYFYELFTADFFVNLPREPYFWISVGVLFYYAGSFFQVGTYNYSVNHTELKQFEMAIHSFSNILMYLLFTQGLLCRRNMQSLT